MKGGKKSICAFIDILGFSEMVLKSDIDGKLAEYFAAVETLVSIPGISAHIKTISISDSLIINLEVPGEGYDLLEEFQYFLYSIAAIQSSMATKGVWTRGGISHGTMIFNPEKSLVVGDAFIKAINLEKEAVFPRVILDTSLIQFLEFTSVREMITKTNQSSFGDLLFDYYKHPESAVELVRDNPLFIDFAEHCSPEINTHDPEWIINALCKDTLSLNKHYSKYEWLSRYMFCKLGRFKESDTRNLHPWDKLIAKLYETK